MEIIVNDLNLIVKSGSSSDYRFCYNLAKKNMLDLVLKNLGKWNSSAYNKSFKETENYLIYKNKTKIGFFRIKKFGKTLFLEDIQIISRFQGKGIGLELMRLIERIALKKKAKNIVLTVFEENKAKNLYKKLGFKKVKDKSGNRILMRKSLR